MNIDFAFPHRVHWTAQDLADAVPLQLFQLLALEIDASAANAGDHRPARTRDWHGGYLRQRDLPAFVRVHC